MELQIEVSTKMAKLTEFQKELNDRYHCIVKKTDYMDLSGPSTSHGPSGTLPHARSHCYALNLEFLPPDLKKPWYTMASAQLTDRDITTISEWLRSGGTYCQYAFPACWLKLLLDSETSRSLD